MSTTSPSTAPTHTVTLSVPSFGGLTHWLQNIHWGKAVTFIAFTVLALVAGYNGWVALPSVSSLYGAALLLLAVVAVIGPFVAVHARARSARKLGVVRTLSVAVALLGGGYVVNHLDQVSAMFTGATIGSAVGAIAALLTTGALVVWFCQK